MKYVNCQVLTGADTGSVNGSQIDANQLFSATFHTILGDATAAGTVKIQASNDINADVYQPATFTVTNWVDIPNATASVASGAATLITLSTISCRWLRVVYTRSGGGSTTVTTNMFATCV